VAEWTEFDDPCSQLESLLRSAGSYVQVSEDLRPSILEASRYERAERRMRKVVRRSALVIVLLSGMMAVARPAGDSSRLDLRNELAAATPGPIVFPFEVQPRADHYGWQAVDIFTALRRQQAQRLRSL
jgi:hypothetical protein